MPKQISERRRRSRAGSILNVNFNGGGVLLLLGAAAGALLATSFAAHRIRAHKKRMTDAIQRDYCEHLAPHEANMFVDSDGGAGDGANAGEGVVQVNSHENLDASVQFSLVDQRDFNLLEELKGKISCITSKEDDEKGIKSSYKEEWGEREEIEEKKTSSNWYSEQSRLLEKKAFQNLEMAIAIEESKFDLSFMNEMYNSILEFVLSRDKEMEISSSLGDKDEINQLIEKVELISGASGEANKALNMAQNDSGKRLEMVIVEEDEIVVESGAFKDAVRLDILCTEQDNENGEPSNDKMVEGSRGLCEQIGALSHESSVSTSSKLESCIRGNPTMIMLEDDTTQEEKTEENMLNGFIKNVESSETKEKVRENEECPQRNEFSLEQDNLMAYKESPLIFQGIEPNDDKLNNSEKKLEREECRASNQDSQAQIKEVEEEKILKLSFGLLEKGVKVLNKTIKQDAMAELIDVDKKRQCQVEAYENNVSSRGKQRRIAIKNHMLMGYPNGNIFLLITLATAFAVLAFLYAKYFITIFEDFITR